MASSDKPTFKGSCHCGFVTYTVAIDPSNRKAGRCNCTWCQKPGYTNLSVSPEDFTLLTPSSKEEMGDYNPKGNNHHRRFCPTCATHVLREGSYEFNGQKHDFFQVNLLTIDQPQDGIDLKDFKITYVGLLNGNFTSSDEPYPGGAV